MPPAIEEEILFPDEEDETFDRYHFQKKKIKTEPETMTEPDQHTQRVAKVASTTSTSVPASTPYHDKLRALPEIRKFPWRAGQVLPDEDVNRFIQGNRVQQKGALLLVTRGDAQSVPCTRCANGNGRFAQCVALEEWYSGACATCVFQSKGADCSLRARPIAVDEVEEEPSTTLPIKKRKRRSTAKILEASGGVQRPRSPDVKPDIQPELYDEPIEYLNAAQKKHKNANHVQAPVLPPAQRTSLPSSAQRLPPPYTASGSYPPATFQPPPADRSSQHDSWNARSTSQQSSRQLPSHSTGFTPVSSAPAPRYESMSSDSPVALIDTLPKAKQRQMYALISGLQGGIAHLEKQLNSLKTLLGIPEDDVL